MPCPGLSVAACCWILEMRRRLVSAMDLFARFGATGMLIAVALILLSLLGREWARGGRW